MLQSTPTPRLLRSCASISVRGVATVFTFLCYFIYQPTGKGAAAELQPVVDELLLKIKDVEDERDFPGAEV